MFSEFLNLPKDIRNEILLTNPGTSFLTLSKNTLASITDKICETPVTPKELKEYLEQNPKIFIFFDSFEFNKIYIYTRIGNKEWHLQGCYMYRNQNNFYLQTGVTNKRGHRLLTLPLRKNINDILETFNSDIWTLDPISHYRIISQRLSCVNADSNYAKYWTKRNYQSNREDLSDTSNINNFLASYIYFNMFSWIFNINVDPLINYDVIGIKVDKNSQPLPGEMRKPEIQQLASAIQYLSQESEKRINNIELYV